jgi:hypothetical protein
MIVKLNRLLRKQAKRAKNDVPLSFSNGQKYKDHDMYENGNSILVNGNGNYIKNGHSNPAFRDE